MREIWVKSTLDGSLQPSLLYTLDDSEPRPLLVGLHTWSYDRFNQVENMLPLAEKYRWNLLLPEFRGPNLLSNPHGNEACGSVLAKQDIIDAVEHITASGTVDMDKILLLGGSGGGHMALLMAAYRPELWKGVAAYVPITDLAAWFYENPDYTAHIGHCCGGDPEGDALAEYRSRSPLIYGEDIARANVLIGHGKFDPSVPFTHSLRLYREITDRHPDARIFLNIFDGGHELLLEEAGQWLALQLDKQTVVPTGLTG